MTQHHTVATAPKSTNAQTLQELQAVRRQLDAIEARVRADVVTPDAQARMLTALEAGPKSVPQLQAQLGLTKSAAHYAALELAADRPDKPARIWIRKAPVPGKPGRWTNMCYLITHVATQ